MSARLHFSSVAVLALLAHRPLLGTAVVTNPHGSVMQRRAIAHGHRRCAPRLAMVPGPLLLSPLHYYNGLLSTQPLLTNCLTAATLAVVSDSVAQSVARQPARAAAALTAPAAQLAPTHDFSRSAWMALWGFMVSGLVCSAWFAWLNSVFPVQGLTFGGALRKVCVNQAVMSPALNILFFTFTTFTRPDRTQVGVSRRALLHAKLAKDLVPTMKKSTVYWGSIQLVNFLCVPTMYTMLYTNVGFLIWTFYISLVGFRAVKVKATHQ